MCVCVRVWERKRECVRARYARLSFVDSVGGSVCVRVVCVHVCESVGGSENRVLLLENRVHWIYFI